MNYAKAFRILRATFGLRQAELASRLNISASQLSLVEAGKRQPSLRTVDELARALSVPRALVALLASSAEEVKSQADQDIADLAKMLLRLLVSASEDQQRTLPFSEVGR